MSDMPSLIALEDLEKKIDFHHAQTNYVVRESIFNWLEEQPKVQAQIVRWLNAVIAGRIKASIEHAVRTREQRVRFEIDLDKVARDLLSKTEERAREHFPLNKLALAMLFLAEDQGYDVSGFKISVDRVVPIRQTTASVRVDAPRDLSEALGALEDTSKASEPEVQDAVIIEVKNGCTYSNDKGVHRKVTGIDGERVSYVVTKTTGKKPVLGSSGSVSMSTFLNWLEFEVEVTEAAPEATPPV
jgi:predicted transcriptional regulator